MTFQLYSKETEKLAKELIEETENMSLSKYWYMSSNGSNYDLALNGKLQKLEQRQERIANIKKWCEEDWWIMKEIVTITQNAIEEN